MPVFNVGLADGRVLGIEAADEQAAGKIAQEYLTKQSKPAAAPVTASGLAKSLGSGAVEGLAQLAGLPGDINNAVNKYFGINKDAQSVLPTGQSLTDTAKDAGLIHEPENKPEEYAQSVGQFLPNVAAGPGGVARRVLAEAVVPGVATQAARDANLGVPAELGAALLAPAAVNKMIGARSAARAAAAAPSTDALFTAANKDYDAVRGLGVEYSPGGVNKFVDRLQSDLTADGHGPRTAGTVHGIIDDLRVPQAGTNQTINDFQAARQQLRTVAQDYTKPSEQRAASLAINDLDRWLSTRGASDVVVGDAGYASQLLSRARANYAAGMRAEMVAKALKDAGIDAAATNSGLNVGNKARQKFASILKSDKKVSGFTDAEIDAMTNVVKGSTVGNALRRLGNMLGGGGGIAQTGMMALGGSIGASEGGAPGAIEGGTMAALVGALARKGANASTLRQINKLDEMVRSRNALNRVVKPTPTAPQGPPAPLLGLPKPAIVPPAPPAGVAGPGFTMHPGTPTPPAPAPAAPLALPAPGAPKLPALRPDVIHAGPPEPAPINMPGPNPGNLPALRGSSAPAVSQMTGPEMKFGPPAVRNQVGPAIEGDVTGVSFTHPQLPPPLKRLAGPESVIASTPSPMTMLSQRMLLLKAMGQPTNNMGTQLLIARAKALAGGKSPMQQVMDAGLDIPDFLRRK